MFNIKKATYIGSLSAISFLLMTLISIPILPSAPFLRYEPSEIPALFAAFIFGPTSGVLVMLIKDILYFFFKAVSPFGPTADFVAGSSFVYIVSLLYLKGKDKLKGIIIISVIAGILVRVIIMLPVNLVILPLQFGIPISNILDMFLPILVPFNFIKALLNGVIGFWVFNKIWVKVTGRHCSFPNSISPNAK